jgi:DNA-binding NarL/FixJ family response regulator
MRAIRVVLGDDHVLVREGIKACLESPRVLVVGEAEDGRELVRCVQALRPDIALVDVSMPLLNGIEATRQIARISPGTRVVILSMFDDKGTVSSARGAGAWAYVLKDEAPDHLVRTIERVHEGERSFPAGTEGLPSPKSPVDLTPREREVLQLVAEGMRSAEMARVMKRSVCTIRNHRARLMKKLGVRTAAALVEKAEELGVVRLEAARRSA